MENTTTCGGGSDWQGQALAMNKNLQLADIVDNILSEIERNVLVAIEKIKDSRGSLEIYG